MGVPFARKHTLCACVMKSKVKASYACEQVDKFVFFAHCAFRKKGMRREAMFFICGSFRAVDEGSWSACERGELPSFGADARRGS